MKKLSNLKKVSFFVLSIIIIVWIYYFISPIDEPKFENLQEHDYSLSIYNVNKDNKWSNFKKLANGKFFIHPGENQAVKVSFKFKKTLDVNIDLSINKASKLGKINFILYKNNYKTADYIVTPDKPKSLLLKLKNGDTLTIVADKFGDTGQDWGNITIKVRDNYLLYKSYFVLLLWIILFIILYFSNYIYLFFNSYLLFCAYIYSEKLNFSNISLNLLFLYFLLGFLITIILIFFYQYLKKYKILLIFPFILNALLMIFSLVMIFYNLNFHKQVTQDIILAILQTNPRQAYEFIHSFIDPIYVFGFLLIIFLLSLLFYLQAKKKYLKINKYFLVSILSIILIVLSLQYKNIRIPNFVFSNVYEYYKELKIFKEILAKRKAGQLDFNAEKKSQGETYVVVIGESLNKKNMSLYGYFRNTTPNLSKLKKDLIIFNNAYSHHTHTMPVLTKALTESNQYNGKKFFTSISIFDILNKANIDSYWLTNQVLYGPWDSAVTVLFKSAKYIYAINKSIGKSTATQKYDEELIKEFKKILFKKSKKNRVIFVHLMGSHAEYKERYPNDKFSIFKGKLDQGIFGSEASKNDSINYYDNSIAYTDYVVSTILKIFMKYDKAYGFLFFSDHADDNVRNLGHNSGMFTYEMIQIPMMFWVSKLYKEKYPYKVKELYQHRNTMFTNDLLYDTLIGFFNIKTDKYQSIYDLTSEDYHLTPEKALLFKRNTKINNEEQPYLRFTDKRNYLYWQKKNVEYLISTNQDSRIYPYRVNSVGKLYDVWNDGFRAFELDLRFDNNSLRVGNESGLMGLELLDFLSKIDYKQIKKILLNFNNLNKSNYRLVLSELEKIDKRFNLKNKIILESNNTYEFFKIFKENGWYTSYYLPTKKIVKIFNENKKGKLENLASKIAKQIKLQKVSAISFDGKLYPFVKYLLESKIPKNILYHTWFAPKLSDTDFKNKLLKDELYNDKRIKTLLTKYYSLYNL